MPGLEVADGAVRGCADCSAGQRDCGPCAAAGCEWRGHPESAALNLMRWGALACTAARGHMRRSMRCSRSVPVEWGSQASVGGIRAEPPNYVHVRCTDLLSCAQFSAAGTQWAVVSSLIS